MAYRIAVDTGGTFCDFVLHDESTGDVHIAKVSSTPDDPSRAIVEGVRKVLRERQLDARDVHFFSHGTTVGTNALIEGKGARVGMLVTEGFRGIYEVREQSRGFGKYIYDLNYEKSRPLVWPDATAEVPERVGAGGEVVRPLDEARVRAELERLRDMGVESLAVVLLFSFLYPGHEQRVAEIAAEVAPDLPVSLSSAVLPQIREYYRMSTTLVNAYLVPVLSRYLERLERNLLNVGLQPQRMFVMQSNGGVASFAEAGTLASTTALSGPAAGVMAACALGAQMGEGELITFDMGGTSCDVSLIHQGRPSMATRAKVAGYDLATPLLDIHTVGAGGGTIAWLDSVGSLKVGPRSAGADPGPVAYGRGGMEVTITDCNLVLGYLNPVFLSGELQLDLEAARAAVQRQIAEPLGCSVIEAADAVIRLINVTMAEAVKAISSQRGYDLRRFYLVAFGGGGPIHAGRIALDLGMRGVVVPEYPGVFSALGLLLSDVRHDLMRSRLKPWAQTDPGEVSALLSELREAGAAILAREGFAPAQMAFEAGVDLRYRGQGYELTVPLTRWPETAEDLREIRRRFDDLHEERFGHRAEDAEVDWVQARLTAVGRVERPHLRRAERVAGSQPEAYMMRRAYFPETGAMDVPVYLRQHLSPGMVLTGPAIVEQYDTTIVVYPGMSAVMDEWRNFILRPDQAR